MSSSGRRATSDDGWTSEVSSGLALAGFLGLVFAAVTLLAMGPLVKFDAYFNLATPPASWLPTLHAVDRIGQRAVCLPILAVVTFLICRRHESWLPAMIVAVSVFTLNMLVLVLKIGLARGTPFAADPSFFSGGQAYPSGHSANVVLVYGLVGYLILHYGYPGAKARAVLWALVPVLAVIMVWTSLTLNWHWFTDLLAGLLIGGVVLQATVTVDRVIRRQGLTNRWRKSPRKMVRLLRAGRSRGPANPA